MDEDSQSMVNTHKKGHHCESNNYEKKTDQFQAEKLNKVLQLMNKKDEYI